MFVILVVVFLIPFILSLFGVNPNNVFKFGLKKPKDFFTLWISSFGVVGLAINIIHSQTRIRLQEKQGRDNRFAKSVELLGHESESTRMGGAYNLYFLAKDFFDEYGSYVSSILSYHIRVITGTQSYQNKFKDTPSIEIQSMLNILTIDLPNRDSHIDLMNSYLVGANLEGANLEKAKLMQVNLEKACLVGANLKGANLVEAKLMQADLRKACLEGANLEKACLIGANLMKVDLGGARLKHVNLMGVFLMGANLEKAKLMQVNMEGAYLIEANLKEAILWETNSKEASFWRAHLEGAYLVDVNLEGAYLVDVNLEGANLVGGNFKRTCLACINLEEAHLKDVHLEEAYCVEVEKKDIGLEEKSLEERISEITYSEETDLLEMILSYHEEKEAGNL